MFRNKIHPMKTEQSLWLDGQGWKNTSEQFLPGEASIVFAFGGIDVVGSVEILSDLKTRYNKAQIILASTAGEIHGNMVYDGSVSVTACKFDHTNVQVATLDVLDFNNSYECGRAIQKRLLTQGLTHILIFSDGIKVNGDDLVKGVNEGLPNNIVVTGGLAADAGRFTNTLIGVNDTPSANKIAAIGFYGDRLVVTHGSQGGWDVFGPVREVTKSNDNVLYELDGASALEIYKRYLGSRASELPGSALLFPLCILGEGASGQLVRTILSIDENMGSMKFAGNIPEGSKVQFMMANFDRLVDGAGRAAEQSALAQQETPDLVMMISCVGRKIVLDQRIEEEVESVCEVFGDKPSYTGFYSNGEISPLLNTVGCSLHNQTMTITTYREK
jgi:hypothetical protein